MNNSFTVDQPAAGQRLDVFCVSKLPQYSRTAIQKAIKAGYIRINSQIVKARAILQANQVITVNLPDPAADSAPIKPIEIPILFEDKDIVVINKPAGISVHPGAGAKQFTVVDWFISKYPASQEVGDHIPGQVNIRPGIVHRLDKDTSGVMLIAKTQKAFDHFKGEFQRQHNKKEYLALVYGVPGEDVGRVVRPLARSKRNPMRRTIDEHGKEAITNWRREEAFTQYALIRAFPVTGRMHQIRVHLHFLGFPIVGDTLYTFKRQKPPEGVKRQLLHAEQLMVTMLAGHKQTFVAPLPEDFATILDKLRHPHGVPSSPEPIDE